MTLNSELDALCEKLNALEGKRYVERADRAALRMLSIRHGWNMIWAAYADTQEACYKARYEGGKKIGNVAAYFTKCVRTHVRKAREREQGG